MACQIKSGQTVVVKVWQCMLEQHNSQSALLVGSSTHNERMERLWSDVRRCVAVLFADLFRGMEAEGIPSCLNKVDLFCLHSCQGSKMSTHL